MPRYAIGLGSNLGGRRSLLRAALALIGELGEIIEISGLYETDPVGPPQPRYLNAAVALHCSLAPRPLLERLLAFERWLGRVRRERWGPRTVDLDLLLWDGPPLDEPGLTLPHPRIEERAFVLAPLRDVWPDPRWSALLEAMDEPTAVAWEGPLDSLEARALAWPVDPGARAVVATLAGPESLETDLRIAAVAVLDAQRVVLVGEPRSKVL
ncbi:MAG: 2-amino-4-hydroxy-6-hydroxymethyldihydropteridine diphosphokinase [Sandaracinaceae bacterium]|nr:2-amino-4-hydroxy-6-hydroxymethyldihydropteridine diphosphokinase [Sandaracinaceae bacterium]